MKHTASKARPQAALGRRPAMVAFLFGLAGRPEIHGTALIRLLGDLGLSAPAARALLIRMRRLGLLASTRRGREAAYRPAGPFAQSFERVVGYASGGAVRREWSGAFHAVLYQVPERERSYRDSLRRTAVLIGYGLLQDGVLISAHDRNGALAEIVGRQPTGARVVTTQLRMASHDAARCALEAWNLGKLASDFRRHIATLERALSAQVDPPAPSASTLRHFADLTRAPLTDTSRDPRLPAALLPDDWPSSRLQQLIAKVYAVFGRAATTYVIGVLNARR